MHQTNACESLMVMPASLGRAGAPRFSIPARSQPGAREARRHGRLRAVYRAAVLAWRHADHVGEARAERAQRAEADLQTDLGHRPVGLAQQRLGALDPARHQVRPGWLAVLAVERA